MKTFYVIATLTLFCVNLECTPKTGEKNPTYDIENAQQVFRKFRQDYGKLYCSETDKKYRYRLFVSVLKKINEINSDPYSKYKAQLTQFADLTEEEVEKCCVFEKLRVRGQPKMKTRFGNFTGREKNYMNYKKKNRHVRPYSYRLRYL